MAHTTSRSSNLFDLPAVDPSLEGDGLAWQDTADDSCGDDSEGSEANRASGSATTSSFVDLILTATEMSEDEGEVRDLVDTLFDRHHSSLADLREEHLAAP